MLAVTGGKGGVGKTTTALGVATALARDGHRPIVVDADLDAPDLAAMAEVDHGGVGAVADGGSLSAVPTVAGVTVLGTRSGTTPATLRRCLDQLAGRDRPVVVDCPAGVGVDHGLALNAATHALLVTRATRPALADALKTGTLARRLGTRPHRLAVTAAREVPARVDGVGLPKVVAVPPADETPRWRTALGRFDGLLGWN